MSNGSVVIDRYVQHLEWLRAISQRLTKTRSLAEVLDVVHDGVHSGLGYDRVGINLFDYETGTFEDLIRTDAAGNKYLPTERTVELHADSPIWSFPGIAAMLRGDPYYFTEDATAECPPELLYLFDGAPKHNIMVPLTLGEQVSGMISVDNLPSGRPIERHEVDALLSVAGQVSRAVENARLLEALRQSEASFRLLFEDNPLPMWVYDLETLGFLEVNDAAVARYGYTRDQFLRMRIVDIRPEEDVDRLRKEIQASRLLVQDLGEWRHRLADGTVIDVEISSHSLTFEERPAAIVVARDVTQHKRDTQSLAEAEVRYRALVEQFRQSCIDLARIYRMMRCISVPLSKRCWDARRSISSVVQDPGSRSSIQTTVQPFLLQTRPATTRANRSSWSIGSWPGMVGSRGCETRGSASVTRRGGRSIGRGSGWM